MGLRYCGLRVTDLDRSRAFYVDRMGLKERKRGRAPHGGLWLLLEDPRTHQRLELNWYPPGSPHAGPFSPGEALDHLGFHVTDPARLFRRLVSEGVPPALAPADPNGVPAVYYLRDPDGNWVELF